MKVIFSHGKESGPWGRKIKVLANVAREMDFVVESIDYTQTHDPEQRVEILGTHLQQIDKPFVLVGSSMGGYVSTVNALLRPASGLFLLAPALYMNNYQVQEYAVHCPTEIVHGWRDDIIPIEHSIRFAQQNGFTLHGVKGDHGLNSALPTIIPLFRQFLTALQTKLH